MRSNTTRRTRGIPDADLNKSLPGAESSVNPELAQAK
jgi:hypothetical protein